MGGRCAAAGWHIVVGDRGVMAMALMYKGHATPYHGRACACCPASPVYAADGKPTRSDPTGTAPQRRAFGLALARRWRSLRPLLRQQLVDRDLLGLNSVSVMSSLVAMQSAAGDGSKLQSFKLLFDVMVRQAVLEGDGAVVRPFVQQGYSLGVAFASKIVKSLASPVGSGDSSVLLTQLAMTELVGIANATSQQASRAVALGLLAKRKPAQIVRSVYAVIESIAVNRSNALAADLMVKAFTNGTLDTYASVGVTRVGVLPEKRVQLTRDAVFVDASRRTGPGSRSSRKQIPSRSTLFRIRKAERQVERLGKVNVRTAGDNDVCPICEDIADSGPYSIDAARSLIPAHPKCRCAFVPADDKRFALDSIKLASELA